MPVLHDTHCTVCDFLRPGVFVTPPDYGDCERCGAAMDWTPAGFSTDVFGHEQYSDAAGRKFTSQHEKEKFMRSHGYEVAGDKSGGARPDLSIRGSAFSYRGQESRVSTAER